MSAAFKPNVSTLQIVEVGVSTAQKLITSFPMSSGHTAEQKSNQLHEWVVAKIESYATTSQPQENQRFLCRKNMVRKYIF